MAVDPRQVLAAFLTLSMFAMLGNMIKKDHFDNVEAAVENVLRGAPVIQISSDSAAAAVPPSKAYDIRHVVKNTDAAAELHKVAQPRPRFKRLGHVVKPKAMPGFLAAELGVGNPTVALAGSTNAGEPPANMGESRENGSVFSVESVDGSHVSQAEPHESGAEAEAEVVGLDLTLGLWPADDRIRSDNVEVINISIRSLCFSAVAAHFPLHSQLEAARLP